MFLQAANLAKEAINIAKTDWEHVGVATVFATLFFLLFAWHIYIVIYNYRQQRQKEKEYWVQTQERETFWEGRLDEEKRSNEKREEILLTQALKGSDLAQNLFYFMDKKLRRMGLEIGKEEFEKLIENKNQHEE